tara:strand:+ start:371 stop:562 length:192 start_codon:yes stop_codon:yes gene_type:complete
MESNQIKYAEEWFKLQDIPTVYNEKSLYVIAGAHWELELSNEEINYRAELYTNSKIKNDKNNK